MADKLFSKLYRIFGSFVFVSFASYFLKLIISSEGNLPWVATTTVMAAVALPFIFRRQLRNLLKKAYVPLKAVMVCGMIFYTVTWICLVGYIYLSPSDTPSESSEDNVYIVFGAKVKKDGPTKTLAARLRRAAELLEADEDGIVIVSGGQGTDEPTTEAECMRDHLISLGVSPQRILMETEAHNTRENIEYSVKLIEETGLGDRRIVCVSSDTHIPRIRLMCKRAGVDAFYVKSETPEKAYLFTTWVREYLSYVKMLVMGG